MSLDFDIPYFESSKSSISIIGILVLYLCFCILKSYLYCNNIYYLDQLHLMVKFFLHEVDLIFSSHVVFDCFIYLFFFMYLVFSY